MPGEILGIMATGIEMIFVGDVAGGEDFVESGGTGFKSIVIVVATVEVDFQAGETGGARKGDGAIAVPERGVRGGAEDLAQNARARRIRGRAEKFRKRFDERGAMGCYGNEQLRVGKGEMQGAIAAHRDTGDGAVAPAGRDAVAFFDEREELLQQEIFVTGFSVFGVDIETSATIGSGNQKVSDFVLLAHVFDEIPGAGVDKGLLVVAKAVEEIEDGKQARLVLVEGRRKDDAKGNGARQDFAGESVAFDTACSGGGGKRGEKKCDAKQGEADSIHSAGRRQD